MTGVGAVAREATRQALTTEREHLRNLIAWLDNQKVEAAPGSDYEAQVGHALAASRVLFAELGRTRDELPR